MKQLFYYLSIFIIAGMASCSEDTLPPNDNEGNDPIEYDGNRIIFSQEVMLKDTFTINEGQELIIEPGTTVLFDSLGLIIANGDLFIEGTFNNRIRLTALNPIGNHRIIQARSGCKTFNLYHTDVEDGLITSYLSNNHFEGVHFTNQYGLAWDNAAARFWYGSVLVENCLVDWNNQGEGFLLHNVHSPVIRNCEFIKVPDAIEYLHCIDGQIIGNVFRGMNDDGVDQNHCTNTLIKDNEFYGIKDRAMELGSERFGSSKDLQVINNLIVDCKVGINIKESSEAYLEQITFVNNGISLDVHTPEDSTRISKAEMVRSVIAQSSTLDISANSRSIVDASNNLCDGTIEETQGNIIGQIIFVDPNIGNYQLTPETVLPDGITLDQIGYQKN